MRRCYYAYMGFLIGFIGLIFLPIGFKVFAFFFPAIFLCISINSEKYNFNLLLFLCILFPFVFIPSQMFTFDASNPFNIIAMQLVVNSALTIVIAFIFYGVPSLFGLMIVWAIIIGKVDSAGKLMVRTVILMGVLYVFLFVFTITRLMSALPLLKDIGTFYMSLINMIFQIPSIMYNLIKTVIKIINSILGVLEKVFQTIVDPTGVMGIKYTFARLPNLPDLPSYNFKLSLDASYQEFNSMSYEQHIYAIHDILPMVMTGACLITALFMTRKAWENEIVKKIGEIFGKTEKRKPRKIHLPNIDFSMYILLAFILFSGWFLYLSYGKNFGHDPSVDYIYLGYFGLYSIIIVVCVLVLTTNEAFYYERATFKNTLVGTVIGVITLKVIMMMFTVQVLDAYSNSELHRDVAYLAIQFLYVAPAESLFFFVFLPGLVFGIILKKINKKVKIEYESERRLKLAVIDSQIETYSKMLKVPEIQKNKRNFAWFQLLIDFLQKKKRRVETRESVIIQQKKAVFGRRNPMILWCAFGVCLPAFLFSTLHFPVLNANTGIDYLTFWNCGLGVIYFCFGIFFILLSVASGYQSPVWSHAIINTLTVWMVIICLGV